MRFVWIEHTTFRYPNYSWHKSFGFLVSEVDFSLMLSQLS